MPGSLAIAGFSVSVVSESSCPFSASPGDSTKVPSEIDALAAESAETLFFWKLGSNAAGGSGNVNGGIESLDLAVQGKPPIANMTVNKMASGTSQGTCCKTTDCVVVSVPSGARDSELCKTIPSRSAID